MREQLRYTVEVRDKNGRRLSRESRKSRSYVRQWNDILYFLIGAVDRAITDTGNTSRTCDRSAQGATSLRFDGAATGDTRGVVVGTGNAAVTISDYALETQIAHGTGLNELTYGASTETAPTVAGVSISFTTTRSFINDSGAAITVKEIGIYISSQDTLAVLRFFCMVRDVLAAAQNVPDGGAITVTYTLTVTV